MPSESLSDIRQRDWIIACGNLDYEWNESWKGVMFL